MRTWAMPHGPLKIVTSKQFCKLIKRYWIDPNNTGHFFILWGQNLDLELCLSNLYYWSIYCHKGKWTNEPDYTLSVLSDIHQSLLALPMDESVDTIYCYSKTVSKTLYEASMQCVQYNGNGPTHAIRIAPRTYLLANLDDLLYYIRLPWEAAISATEWAYSGKLVNHYPKQMGIINVLR